MIRAPHEPRQALARLDWTRIGQELDHDGAAILPGMLDAARCAEIAGAAGAQAWRPAERPGEGRRAMLAPGRPSWLRDWCMALRDDVAPIARRWSQALGTAAGAARGPCIHADGGEAACELLRLGVGERLGLRPAPVGGTGFAVRAVAMLGRPGEDFTGGELVVVEHRPRMQSRATVLPLRQGDVALLPSAARPVRGTRGLYRAGTRLGASAVHGGSWTALAVCWD